MQVSTVVATRNRPRELKIALDAIGVQTYRCNEVLVVDDGSAQDHARANEMLAGALGARATYLFLPVHNPLGSGPAYARNVGISAAKGDLVAFCDDDDYWCDARHVEMAVQAFAADASLELVFANQEAHRNGQLVREAWLPHLESELGLTRQSPDRGVRVSRRDCLLANFGHMNTCVFRRDLLLRIGCFWEQARYLEDMDLFVRAVDAARGIQYRPRTVSVHNIPDRTRKDNASTLFEEPAKDIVRVGIANHLTLCCRSIEARRYAGRLAGYAYRCLAREASRLKRDGAAFSFAMLGLAWLPTLRWIAYTAYLGFKLMLSLSRPRRNGSHPDAQP